MVDRVLQRSWTISAAAAAAEVSERTCSKWVARHHAEGALGLLDRSSAPVTVANRTDPRRVEAIAALRRLRFSDPEIADVLEMPLSTDSGVLTRIGMGRLGRLGLEPAERYERERPGELIYVDVKKLGRIIVLSDEKAVTAIAFLRRAVAFFTRHGITVERVLTDNGSAYRSTIHAIACRSPSRSDTCALDRGAHRPTAGLCLHPHHARRLGLRRDLRLQPRTHRSP